MTDSPIDVWTQHANPAGSGRYYALLHCEDKDRLSATLTLISIWSKLCFSNVEIDAAKKKLDWWQQELDRSTPQHPVTKSLIAATSHSQASRIVPLLQTVLSGYGALLTEGSRSRLDPNRLFHQHTGANAALGLCDTDNTDAIAAIESVGIALSKFRCVRHMHKHIANGLLCLPFDELTAQDVSPAELVPGNYTANTSLFLNSHLQSIADGLIINQQSLSAFTDAGGTFLYIYASLQSKLLAKIQADLKMLDQPDIRLSPIKNFWLAQKAARQLRKIR